MDALMERVEALENTVQRLLIPCEVYETQIGVLREDFSRERRDRARAVEERDSLKTKLDKTMASYRALECKYFAMQNNWRFLAEKEGLLATGRGERNDDASDQRERCDSIMG